jgi:hypothetical protein
MVGWRPEVFEAVGEGRSESVTEDIRAFGGVGTAARVVRGWLTFDGDSLVVSTGPRWGGLSREEADRVRQARPLRQIIAIRVSDVVAWEERVKFRVMSWEAEFETEGGYTAVVAGVDVKSRPVEGRVL